jgi:stage II sporulation protein D
VKGKVVLIAVLVMLGIPWLFCRILSYFAFSQTEPETIMEEPITQSTQQQNEDKPDYQIPVLTGQAETVVMPLEAYLEGVLFGEMPASFQLEALKAQAVVARTYTIKRYSQSPKHPSGAICTDSFCCQAYSDPSLYPSELRDKIHRAVSETQGLVVTYQGNLIDATYFSCSGGQTEAAVAVWGTDVPYLQSVESPGEEYASVYSDTVTYSLADFERMLSVDLEGPPEGWFTEITYTPGGGIDRMKIGGREFSGTQIRSFLNLRSTVFVLTSQGESVSITTRGYGHRVGMSQYGAEAMAQKGSDYQEILAHYYPGTTVESRRE